MDREAIKERVRFYTEYLKILWFLIAGVSGGLVSLFFALDTAEKVIVFIVGLAILFGLVSAVIKLTLDVRELLKKLEVGG